jgi:carboxypeptidase Taq
MESMTKEKETNINQSSKMEALKRRLYDINALDMAGWIFGWDQEVNMPKEGAAARAEHLSILSRMSHELLVDDQTQRLLEDAKQEANPGSAEEALVRLVQRKMDIATKLPAALVEKKAKASSVGQHIWQQARAENNFEKFRPYLEENFSIAQEEANAIGYKEHIYDALLDQYEEGATANECKQMFDSIKAPLVSLIQNINENGRRIDNQLLNKPYEEQTMLEFIKKVLGECGFDFNKGRLDKSTHPFCSGFSINDSRITTRFIPDISSALLSSMHEMGHAFYEMGSTQAWDRLPMVHGVSLGVHESQSRLWENIVGRSKAFWKHYYPELQKYAPSLSDVSLDDFHSALNKVTPSFIRVEADELTYNMHVMLRFELECDLLTNKLQIKDLPSAWNDKMKAYLGITPPNDTLGCLQDVHWSWGSIGYFPTYSIGNLLSCQIWKTLQREIPNTEELIEKAQFAPIHNWLKTNVYQHGSRYAPKDLVKRVTGKPLDPKDYLDVLTAKYKGIYEL